MKKSLRNLGIFCAVMAVLFLSSALIIPGVYWIAPLTVGVIFGGLAIYYLA
jgi:hypothetical protein